MLFFPPLHLSKIMTIVMSQSVYSLLVQPITLHLANTFIHSDVQ